MSRLLRSQRVTAPDGEYLFRGERCKEASERAELQATLTQQITAERYAGLPIHV